METTHPAPRPRADRSAAAGLVVAAPLGLLLWALLVAAALALR